MVEGWHCFQVRAPFGAPSLLFPSTLAWAFLRLCAFGNWALPWNSSCLSDLSILLLFLSGSLHQFLFLHCLPVLSSSFKSFHSFIKRFCRGNIKLSDGIIFGLWWVGSYLEMTVSGAGQSLTFFHRGHPCNYSSPKLCHTNTKGLSTLHFQIENPYHLVTL